MSVYVFNRSGGPVHRLVEIPTVPALGRSACGLAGFNYTTRARPETNALECWTTGWRPCARCFPDFDLAKWRELEERYPAETEESTEAVWEAIWVEVYADRKQRGLET